MSRLLLLTQGDTPNIGDNAIYVTEHERFCDDGFDVLSLPFWDTERMINKKGRLVRFIVRYFPPLTDYFVSRWIRRHIEDLEIDLAVIGGGELLGSHYGFVSSMECWTRILSQKRIPVILLGVSGEKPRNWLFKVRYKKALKRCSFAFVRDRYTQKVLEVDYEKKSVFYPDVVYSYRPLKRENNRTEKAILLVLSSYSKTFENIGLKNENAYIDYIATIIEEKDTEKIYITVTEKRDQDNVKLICEKLQRRLTVNCVYLPVLTLDEYCCLADRVDEVVSTRMHAMIIAQRLGKKVTPIAYKKKLIEYESMINSYSTNELNRLAEEGFIACMSFLHSC